MNTDTAYQPAARSSFEEQRALRDIQRHLNGKPLWSKAFLITFWVLQLLICIVAWAFGAFYIYAIIALEHSSSDAALMYLFFSNLLVEAPWLITLASASATLFIAWATVSFALIVTEIVMFSRQNLKPAFEVTSSSVKTALWLILFIIAVVGTVARPMAGFTLIMYGVFT